MQRRWTTLISTALVALVLGGCVRADAELTVSADDEITGTIEITAPLAEDTDAARESAGGIALTVEQRVLPGLRDVAGVTATGLDADGSYGTRLTLEDVSIEDLTLGGTPLVQRLSESQFLVSGVIDTTGLEGVPVPAAEGERAPGAEQSEIRIALTFPGDVDEVGGTVESAVVEGKTVTWTTTFDQPITLQAEASSTAALFSADIWRTLVYGIGALAVLAVAGLITVFIRGRND